MMRPPETVYRGERLYDRQVIIGVRVTVNGHPLDIATSQKVIRHAERFEWSYSGAGSLQLALALVLDATGDAELARRVHRFVKHGVVKQWRRDTWEITAGMLRAWIEQAEREDAWEYGDRDAAPADAAIVRQRGGVA